MYLDTANHPLVVTSPLITPKSISTLDQYRHELQRVVQKFIASPLVHLTDISSLSTCEDGESWATTIIKTLLDNLSFDGSVYGRFGTPDTDILGYLQKNIPTQKVWIKILGNKLEILKTLLANTQISDIHKTRIERIMKELGNIYQSTNPSMQQ